MQFVKQLQLSSKSLQVESELDQHHSSADPNRISTLEKNAAEETEVHDYGNEEETEDSTLFPSNDILI